MEKNHRARTGKNKSGECRPRSKEHCHIENKITTLSLNLIINKLIVNVIGYNIITIL